MPCDVTGVSTTKRRPLVRFCHSVALKTICCHISKGIFFLHLQTKALEKEWECQNLIHGRQLLAETSVTSPGVPCHINIYYKHMYIYMLCTFIHKYIYYIYDNIFTSRYTCYVYIWISYIFISTNIIQT